MYKHLTRVNMIYNVLSQHDKQKQSARWTDIATFNVRP